MLTNIFVEGDQSISILLKVLDLLPVELSIPQITRMR